MGKKKNPNQTSKTDKAPKNIKNTQTLYAKSVLWCKLIVSIWDCDFDG